ncbi:MAG TPA: circadian clock KaiB family protein [Stellaceae bacterium]|nr:circadian clock KaiB family protein [Stellaceae bacterium]
MLQLMEGRRRVATIRLRLYIAGDTVISQKARENLGRICARHSFPIDITITDVLREPELADRARILATPTLIHEHPTRPKRIIGDLTDIEKIIEFLGLQRGNDDHEQY